MEEEEEMGGRVLLSNFSKFSKFTQLREVASSSVIRSVILKLTSHIIISKILHR